MRYATLICASFLGLIALKGTPPAAIQVMGQAIEQALQRPELRDALLQRTVLPQHLTGREFCAKVILESRAMKKVIADNGITVNN